MFNLIKRGPAFPSTEQLQQLQQNEERSFGRIGEKVLFKGAKISYKLKSRIAQLQTWMGKIWTHLKARVVQATRRDKFESKDNNTTGMIF